MSASHEMGNADRLFTDFLFFSLPYTRAHRHDLWLTDATVVIGNQEWNFCVWSRGEDENVLHVGLMKRLKTSNNRAKLQQHGFHLHISNETVAYKLFLCANHMSSKPS